jgi:hypothetical protein
MHVEDRRRMTLSLTTRGRELLDSAYRSALDAMAKYLASLDEQERAEVTRAMEILNPIFASSIARDRPVPDSMRVTSQQDVHHIAAR